MSSDAYQIAYNKVKGTESRISELEKRLSELLAELRKTGVEIDNSAQTRQDKKEEFDLRKKGTLLQRHERFRKIIDTISKPFRIIAALLFDRKYPVSHYFALFLVILILIGGLSFAAAAASSKKKKKKEKSPFSRFFENIFGTNYKVSLLANRLVGGEVVTEPRDTVIGRCDNVQYKQYANMCVNTKLPDPIIWDMQELDELGSIPQKLRDKLTKNGTLLKVFIPWKAAGSFYIPDCNAAYYLNGENSFLLVDDGFQCTKSTFPKMTYQQAMRINKLFSTYKGLDVFE